MLDAFRHHLLVRRRQATRLLRAFLTADMSSTDDDSDSSSLSDYSWSLSPSASDVMIESSGPTGDLPEPDPDSEPGSPPARRPRLDSSL